MFNRRLSSPPQTTISSGDLLLIMVFSSAPFLGNLYGTTPRFLVLVLPPFLIIQAHLFSTFLKKSVLFRFLALLFSSFIITKPFSHIYPILKFQHEHTVLPDYVKWVSRHVEKNARVITTDEGSFYLYYGFPSPMGRPLNPFHYTDEDLFKFKNRVDQMLDQGIPIYIPESNLMVYNYGKQFSKFMQTYYDFKYVGKYLYETWHMDLMRQRIWLNPLYRLYKK